MAIRLALQYACRSADLPTHRAVIKWIRAALARRCANAEVTVRIVGEAEGADLNRRWRKRRGATNVLSFASEGLDHAACAFLGDIVVCAPVVMREAHEQLKSPEAHWAHLIVHGVLHLLGYDHQRQREAEAMEKLEQDILERLGYPNPYSDVPGA
ncbi:MAG: rRNA maturation RNase YbeY [Gammaproteobacteria bacterium]